MAFPTLNLPIFHFLIELHKLTILLNNYYAEYICLHLSNNEYMNTDSINKDTH